MALGGPSRAALGPRRLLGGGPGRRWRRAGRAGAAGRAGPREAAQRGGGGGGGRARGTVLAAPQELVGHRGADGLQQPAGSRSRGAAHAARTVPTPSSGGGGRGARGAAPHPLRRGMRGLGGTGGGGSGHGGSAGPRRRRPTRRRGVRGARACGSRRDCACECVRGRGGGIGEGEESLGSPFPTRTPAALAKGEGKAAKTNVQRPQQPRRAWCGGHGWDREEPGAAATPGIALTGERDNRPDHGAPGAARCQAWLHERESPAAAGRAGDSSWTG